MVLFSRKLGPFCLLYGERSMERRQRSWVGVGPMWMDAEPGNNPRVVLGFCVHAGRHYVVFDWAVLRRERAWPHAPKRRSKI